MASREYSTWKRRPSGEKVLVACQTRVRSREEGVTKASVLDPTVCIQLSVAAAGRGGHASLPYSDRAINMVGYVWGTKEKRLQEEIGKRKEKIRSRQRAWERRGEVWGADSSQESRSSPTQTGVPGGDGASPKGRASPPPRLDLHALVCACRHLACPASLPYRGLLSRLKLARIPDHVCQ